MRAGSTGYFARVASKFSLALRLHCATAMRWFALLLVWMALPGCNKSSEASPAGPAFSYDASLPPTCKANIEFLVSCAGRKTEPARADLLGRARTMQNAYAESVKKDGPSKAGARCTDLSSIVRSNPACK